MRAKGRGFCWAAIALLTFGSLLPAAGQVTSPGSSWYCRLTEGSVLTRDCLVCDRIPTIPLPLEGGFVLQLVEEHFLYSIYQIRDVNFTAGWAGLPDEYRLTGSGQLRIGGEVALQQQIQLKLEMTSSGGPLQRNFTNADLTVTANWPNLTVDLQQTEPDVVQFFTLHLVASPLREIWFSTAGGMTSALIPAPDNHYSTGDVLSASGRAVKRLAELMARLGLMPGGVPDLNVDALDIAPGGEVLFSLSQDVFSETLGQLHHGDLLSDRGRVVKRNGELLAAFAPTGDAADLGLDAVQVISADEILFSVAQDFLSGTLHSTITRGDLLSSKGTVVMRQKNLLANFHPAESGLDLGLDALYVWPNGEVWFSIEDGFQDTQLGPISNGDLLSNTGRVIYHNLALVQPFAPIEDLSNFGLDALFIVTDLTSPAQPPLLQVGERNSTSSSTPLSWKGEGRVFQLLKSSQVNGAYAPLGPILPGDASVDIDANPGAFYQLLQW